MAVSVACSCSSSLTPSLRSSFKKKKRKEWLVNVGKGVVMLIREIPIKIISNYQNGKDIKVYFTLPLTIESLYFCFFKGHTCSIWKLGVKLELQLPAYTTAIAMRDPSHICDLHHSSRQCQILNPLSEARDQTYVFLNTGRVLNLLCHNGNSLDIVILVGSVQCYDKPLQRGLYLPKFKIYILFTPVILLHGKIYPTSVLRWCRKVSIM